MTKAQEQAANVARKACTGRMRARRACDEYNALAEWTHYALATIDIARPDYEEIKSAYLAAWRTTWETA